MKFKSNRQFNKWTKKNPLIKDNRGKMIYPFDFVKVQIKWETNTSHCSRVWWNSLDGAYITSHPAHHILNNGVIGTRCLRSYIDDNEDITCEKITYKEFQEWELKNICKNI